jgi:hypothetical protein
MNRLCPIAIPHAALYAVVCLFCPAHSLILASSYSNLQLSSYKCNSLYNPKGIVKRCQIGDPRWPQNLTHLDKLSSTKCCTENFHSMKKCGGVCGLLRGELYFSVQGNKGIKFSMMSFMYLQLEPCEPQTSIFRTQCI